MEILKGDTPTPYTNVPFTLTHAEQTTLSQTDDEFNFVTWEELKSIIAGNHFYDLPRTPSDTRNYPIWMHETKLKYTSIADYIMKERLSWANFLVPSFTPNSFVFNYKSSTPFCDPSDYKILRNDWPYGVTSDITHLVVWSKTPISVTHEGDPTPESRVVIEEFLERTFVSRVGKDDRVVWLKNRVQWQSVRALEHIHVLIRGVSEELVEEWTGERGDILARKWKPTIMI